MASKKDQADQADPRDYSFLTNAPEDWEFETVVDKAAMLYEFDTIGDVFIGQFEGVDHIVPDNGDPEFDRYNFRGRDGELYCINPSYKIQGAQEDELWNKGDWVRMTYVADIPTKRGLNPMKDIKIEVRRK